MTYDFKQLDTGRVLLLLDVGVVVLKELGQINVCSRWTWSTAGL